MGTCSVLHQKVFSKLGRGSAARLDRVCAFLRSVYPSKTADQVAADTGIAAGTVRKWLEAKASPSGAAVVLLTAVYGPEFVCAVMDQPPAWLHENARRAERARIEAQMAVLRARLETTP